METISPCPGGMKSHACLILDSQHLPAYNVCNATIIQLDNDTLGALVIGIDFQAHTPIYVQIVDQLLGHVETGRLKEGEQLPTVRQLAKELKVNFNTVARAYRILDESGVISTQHGRGTFVIGAGRRAKKGANALKRKSLAFLAEAHQSGFQPEEVEREIDKLLRRWQKTGSPTGG